MKDVSELSVRFRSIGLQTPFPGDVVQAVPHHMDDAKLNVRVGINRLNRFWKAFQAIDAGHEDILHAPVLEFGDNLQPELGPFGLGHPQAQHFFLAIPVDADSQMNGFDPDTAVANLGFREQWNGKPR